MYLDVWGHSRKKKRKWECYWPQIRTVEWLSTPHQTVLEMFLVFRKPLYSCTERMCHFSTRPVIALGQCSASNHSIILHSKLPAQGNAWWWKIVQLTQACDMMQRRAFPVLHVHMRMHTHTHTHTHTLSHRWVKHRLHPEYQKQEQMLLVHSNRLCCLLRMSHSTSDSHLPECLEQMKCKKVCQQQSSI